MKWDWEKFYDKFYSWLFTQGPKIILAIIVLLIGIWLVRQMNRWVKNGMERRKLNPSLRYFLQNLIAIALQIMLILLVLQIAGIQLTFLTAIIAGFSVAAGLALSGTLQNFVSGILILILKPYRVGDAISISGNEGLVKSIQLFYTTVITYDNKTITIPNGQLSNNVVINLSKEGERRIDIDLKFSYGIEYEQVRTLLENVINESKKLLTEPNFRIGVSALDADKYTVEINVWTDAHGFTDTKMELQERIMGDLKKSGIKLPGMT